MFMLGTLTLYSQVRPPKSRVANLRRGVSSYPLVSGPGVGSPLVARASQAASTHPKNPGPSLKTPVQTSFVPQRIICTAPAVAAILTAPVPGAWGVMQLNTCGHPLPPHLGQPAPRHAIRTFALCPLDRRSRAEGPPLQHRCLLRWSVWPLLDIGPLKTRTVIPEEPE